MSKKLVLGGTLLCIAAAATAYGVKKHNDRKREEERALNEHKKLEHYLKILAEKRDRENDKIKALIESVKRAYNKKKA